MFRRLLLLALLLAAVLGLPERAGASGGPAGAVAAASDGCDCPCDEDGGRDDDCCVSASCACFPAPAVSPPAAPSDPDPAVRGDPPGAWALGAEQRARERSTVPPTPPPIG